jgi:hypothetical protein
VVLTYYFLVAGVYHRSSIRRKPLAPGRADYFRKDDNFVKSPDAALRCILRRCGVRTSTPHSSGFVRLACGAFYAAVESGSLSGFLD